MGASDPFFQNLIGGALGAAWGAAPGSRALIPGPVSNLSGMLQGDMLRGGFPNLAAAFPTPTFGPQAGTFSGIAGPQAGPVSFQSPLSNGFTATGAPSQVFLGGLRPFNA